MTIVLMLALVINSTAQAIPFKLVNKKIHSISLIIPGVMNPNLSPLSWSGVDLDEGQEIYGYVNGRKVLLLKVDDSLRGKKVNVGKLLREIKRQN